MRTATVLLAVLLIGVASAFPALAQSASPAPTQRAAAPRDPRLASDPSAHVALRSALHGDLADRPASRRMPTSPVTQTRIGTAPRISTLYQYWSAAAWEDGSRVHFAYNDDGLPAQDVSQGWTGSTWEDEYRTVYSYVNGDLAEELYQLRAGTDWVTSSRLLYTYTDSNATEWREQIWAGSWVDYRRILLTYDDAGRYVEALVQDWDSESEWQNESRYFFTYTDADAFAEIRGEVWTGAEWADAEREVYAYAGDGLLAEWVLQGWNGAWSDEYREQYFYADGLLVGSLAQWVDEGGWEDSYRVAYLNDGAGNALEEVGQYFEAPAWVNESRTLHTYATTTSSEPSASAASALAATVFPNPTRTDAAIGITLSTAETVEWVVYDVVGRRVAAGAPLVLGVGTHEVALPLAGLPVGVYIVRVQAAGVATAQRLTIVR